MKKLYRYYNAGPGAGESGGAAAPAAETPPAGSESASQGQQQPGGNGITSFAELDLPPEATIDDIERVLKSGAPAEKKEEEKKGEGENLKNPPKTDAGEEFVLDIKEDLGEAGSENDSAEATWIDMSTALELEAPEEDSFDGFKSAYQKKLDAVKAEAREEGKKEYTEKIAAMSPEAKALFDFLLIEGNTVKDFMQPTRQIDEYLAMDDEALIRADLKARNYDEEMINAKLDELKLDNKTKIHAYDIRKTLEVIRAKKEEQIVSNARAALQAKERQKLEKAKKELEDFQGALTKQNDLWGVPVSPKAKEVILQRFKAGQYRTRLEQDPDLAAEIALLIEFKDSLKSQLLGNAKTEGKESLLKKVHAVSLGQQSSASGKPSDDKLEGFDVWEQKLAEEKASQKGE